MGPPANRNPPRRASTPLSPGPAFERLREKVDRHARQMGVTPAGVSVRAFRSRWGSCTQQGQVVFNWPIIKAPHPVVDYVVIHELAHLVHPNHSRAFWQLVECHCPAYAHHRTWLKAKALELLCPALPELVEAS